MSKIAEFQQPRYDLPMGQKLIREGFSIIDEDQIKAILETDQLMLDRAQELAEEWEDGLDDKEYVEVDERDGYCYVRKYRRGFFSSSLMKGEIIWAPELEYVDYDNYARKQIPDHVLDKVAKAKEAGLKHFFVVEPTFKTDDPVIVGMLGDPDKDDIFDDAIDMIYVAHWGPDAP